MSNRVKMTRHVARRHCQHQPVPSKTTERVLKPIYASFKVNFICQMFDICLPNQTRGQINITLKLFCSLLFPAALGWSVRPQTNSTTTPSEPTCSVQDDRAGLETDLRELQGRFILSNVLTFILENFMSDQIISDQNHTKIILFVIVSICTRMVRQQHPPRRQLIVNGHGF